MNIIYLRISLDGKDLSEPLVCSGVLYDFIQKSNRPEKVEQLMAHIEYKENQIFKDPSSIDYEDASVKFKGQLRILPLYEINSSAEVIEKIVQPALERDREKLITTVIQPSRT